ncbi:type II secretion system F family protein [Pigmentiphaga litoralis]|uniref:Tight adherence protein B n=1 Tax=Pigmentiphaga litoralis TaxID=516702 RepID=A0A7Y9J017_9BURK|nr:type II secretion system F family protein [Pigmentiphaga litoralis]NYE26433.1 tight adherence protein B [Pigmentiphaga litoralis]NYE85553.1 tight adherence protein B [Pigmentiphaga litoralis]
MNVVIIALLVMLGTAIAAWGMQLAVADALKRYRALFTETARIDMSELFLFFDTERLWGVNLLLAGAAAVVSGLLLQSVTVGLVAGAAWLWVPRHAVRWLKRRRLQRFDSQLPDALLALAGALGAGASLQSGLTQVVAEGRSPLAQEFGLMLREQRFGVSLDEALAHLDARVPTEAAHLVVAALRIAADTGGNLAETLSRIAGTLRARLQIEGRIQVMTAQGRLQARVVGGLPPLLIAVLYQLEPDAMRQLWTTATGGAVLAVIVMLELAGLWLIRRIVGIDV